jgi:hypothetical protein
MLRYCLTHCWLAGASESVHIGHGCGRMRRIVTSEGDLAVTVLT